MARLSAKDTHNKNAAKPGWMWRCHDKKLEGWKGLCPGIAKPATTASRRKLQAIRAGLRVSDKLITPELAAPQRGAEPEPTVRTANVPVGRVGNSLAKERAPNQRLVPHETVKIGSAASAKHATIVIDASTPAWAARHPASGFLHSIEDTHEIYELLEHISAIDQLLTNEPPASRKKAHRQWERALEAQKKWVNEQNPIQLIQSAEQRLKKRRNRRKKWTEHIKPLWPTMFRVSAHEIGLRPEFRPGRFVLPSTPTAQSNELYAWRELAEPKIEALLSALHDYHKNTLEQIAALPKREGDPRRLQITLSESYGYPKDEHDAFKKYKKAAKKKQERLPLVKTHRPWNPNWIGTWTTIVKEIVNAADAQPLLSSMELEFDIWNEPNLADYFAAWAKGRNEFFETWTAAAKQIIAVKPNALIVGPSLAGYEPEFFKDFMVHATMHNVVPDVLSWHDQYDADAIATRASELEDIIAEMGILSHRDTPIEFEVNEYLLDGDDRQRRSGHRKLPIRDYDFQTRPGRVVHFIAGIDSAPTKQVKSRPNSNAMPQPGRIRAACHTTAKDLGPFETKKPTSKLETLNGILTANGKRRSMYYVYKRYAEMRGQIFALKLAASEAIRGIASKSNDGDELCVLIGRDDDGLREKRKDKFDLAKHVQNLHLSLNFEKLPSKLGSNPFIEVVRIHIHDVDRERPITLEGDKFKMGRAKIDHNQTLHVPIKNLGQYDALFIRLSRTQKPKKP